MTTGTAILILNWNSPDDTIVCLQSLKAILDGNQKVFVIDNGSNDDSVVKIHRFFVEGNFKFKITDPQELKERFDESTDYYLVCNKTNVGFGLGNNLVLQQLRKPSSDFRFAWLLNNDAVADAKALMNLVKTLNANEKVAAAGSLILNYPDNGLIQCAGVKHYPLLGVSKLNFKNQPVNVLDKMEKVDFDYLNGASLILRIEALERCGFFDERFFLYSEEVDLQLRFQKAGYNLSLVTDSIVYHKLAGGTRNKRHLFYYYYNTSAIILSRKHSGIFPTLFSTASLLFISFMRTFPSFKNFNWSVRGIIQGYKK